MGTTTYTVAQALATTASGILVVDTAANIATNLSNTSLVSRVSLFSMSANGTVLAWEAAALAAIGSKFSTAGYKLTERDSVANLTASAYAAGPTISGVVVAVYDTAANILAAANNPIIHDASSIALTASATLTLAQLVTLETWPSFTAAGLTLTLADSAANLLAFTSAEAKPVLTVFQVSISSTVTAAQATTLEGMSHFGVSSGATLTISDTMADLLAQAATIQLLQHPNVIVRLSAGNTATVSQADTLATLPNFGVAAGQTLTIADTVAHLVTLTTGQAAIATAITLSGNDTATAAQLVELAALPHFSPGHTLTVDDTLADLATLTTTQHALATAETIDDTVSNLLAAPSTAFSGATAIVAELDGTTLDAAQATALAALAAHATLTLHPNGSNTTLTISDTSEDLTAASASITTLEADGSVTVVPTSSSDGSILGASAAAALVLSGVNPANGTYAVADTGSALSAVASQIFGQGFEAITVTSGSFAGTMAQLLDSTLHFAAGSSAQLNASAVSDAAQTLELAALPGFSRASSVTLTVLDSITDILAAAATLPAVATSILANDTETVNAAEAATLATLTGFSVHGNYVILVDTAANLATATAGALALAINVNLAGDARISEATALQFVALGSKFSPNGFFVTIADTAGNLEALAASPSALAVVNSWDGEAVLSADATANVANATALSQLAGFNVGTHHLTISDSASDLLGASSSVLALAYAVQISQASTVTAANAATLESLHNFSAGGLLTIADTPVDLAGMTASLATPASSVSLAVETTGTGGNASGYAIDATQFAAMLALPHFSLTGFTGTVSVIDTAASLAALASSLDGLSSSVLSHIAMTLSTAATVTVATAEALDGLPGFGVGSNNLTISDTAANLLTLDSATAALASAIEVSTSATVTAATAASLAALHNFTTDADPITIADTPANLAAQSAAAAAIATADTIVPITVDNVADYTLDASQFLQLVRYPVSFTGFSGPLNVLDTALDLAILAGSFIGASLTSPIAESRYVLHTLLSADATVTTDIMGYLIGMPNFSLDGHTLVLQDTPSNLLGAFGSEFLPDASEVVLAPNNSAWVVTAEQAAQLAAIGPLNAGTAGMIVSDTVTDLLTAPYAAGIDAATATTLDADATVSVSQAEALQALPDFSRAAYTLTISDTAANIATLDPATAALASSIVTVGGSSSLSVAAFDSLVGAPDFSGTPDSLTVSDSATNLLTLVGSSTLTYIATTMLNAAATLSVANAEQLSTLPNLQIGNNLTIADTAANLLHITGFGTTPDDWAIELQARSVVLTANALSLSAAQATLLAQLGSKFSNGGYTLTVQDTPTALLSVSTVLAPIVGQISSVTLASGTWTISLAQAQQLDLLPNFTAGSVSVVIADSVADLAAGINADLIAGIIAHMPDVSFTLAGDDTASVAQVQTLYTIGGYFSRGTSTLTIIDGAGHLATLNSGQAAMATSIELQGSTLTSVANFQVLRALLNYSNNGNVLVVSDTAAHLLELVSSDVSLAAEIMLSTTATNLSAATAEQLATLPNFTTGIAHLTIQDSAADLLQITGDGSQPDDWAGELAASSVTLTGSATVTAAQADELALLGSRLSLGGHTLTVSDSAANLVSSANAGGLALAGAVTLSGDETALSAANATQLAALSHFSKGGYDITVSDTAANLAFAGNSTGLALADHVQLSQASDMTVAAAEALIGMLNFQTNDAAPIAIVDTLPDLLGLASADLAHNSSVLAATPIELSENSVVTAAQIEALASLPQYGSFSLNGHTLTVEDSGKDLASLTPSDTAPAGSVVMIGDAILTATQADAVAALSVQLNGYDLTVADTATALLNASNTTGLAIATTIALSSATTVDAADATSLFANPLFSTGGYALTVTGSASALLDLGAPIQRMATALVLSEAGDTVSVANLLQLTELGSKFSVDGNSLIVSDTAAQLATLNSLETALVTAAVLGTTPSVPIDTTTATELAALPDFSLGYGVTLTVQGSYAELAALPSSITSIATLELTGSAQTLTAAEAASLVALINFSPSAGVIVQDTIADLNAIANAGWQTAATGGYVVTDSVSNLLNNSDSSLLAHANSVTLLGDAQVDATDFATLAGMANFSRGTAALTVLDGSVAIASNATEIALLASSALIDSSAPVTAAQADALATLNAAHMLSFTGGISLAVQDSFSDLASPSNAPGLALAGTITVVDTVAQLLAATAHDWGAVQPYYELDAGANISGQGQQATTLHGLGGHFLPDGNTLIVIDSAANVVSNSAAIQALGITAQVDDSVAGIDAAATALGTLGSTLQSITLTDSSPVSASAAAGLVPLASKLTAPAIAVSDTASAVDTHLAGLETLGTHLSSVTVTDSAADVAAVASDLAALALDTTLYIVLTDATPVTVSAAVAAGLVPVDTHFGGATVNVSDSGAHIATNAATLAELGAVLGTITLSDGTATDAATAAALAQIDGHLGTGITLSVTDTAVAIAGAAAGLGTLEGDHKLSSITADNDTVADVLAHSTALASLGATATIHDSAAAVSAHLDALEALAGGVLTGITLTDGGTPDIAVSLQQITSDADVLGLISGAFHYAITDTSADIAADLGDGGSSHILTLGSLVDSIAVSGSDTLTLSAATLLTDGVDNGPGSALTKLIGASVAVTGVTVGDFTDIGTLSVVPSNFAVADNSSNIQSDLNDNTGSSVLLAHLGNITSITTSGTITLDYATATTQHVNDGDGSVFSKMSGETLDVTGAPVTGIASLFTTGVHASSVTVTDTAGDISNDLETSSPVLVQYIGDITSMAVSPSGTISLDADHALASGVDDGSGSVLGKMSGETLAVTGATVAQLDALHALYHLPDSVSVTDDATAIANDLALGADSRLETYASDPMLTAVVVTGGPVSLDDSYVVSAVGDALALLPEDSLQVTNVPIGNIVAVAGLHAFASMTVSDSATNIEDDLAPGGADVLGTNYTEITSIVVSGGPVVLNYAEANGATGALALLSGSLTVSGVPVADIASIAAIGALSGIAVSDTAAHIATDLGLGSSSSELDLHASQITSVTVTDSNPVGAANAAGLVPLLAKLAGPAITVSDTASAVNANLDGLETLGTHLSSVTVSDSAADVAAFASDLSALGGKLHISLSDEVPVTVSAAVAAGLVPVVSELAAGTAINVSDTGAAVASDAMTLAELGAVLGTVTLSDSTSTTVATVEHLAPIETNLAPSMTLQVADTADKIYADLTDGNSALNAGVVASLITGISVTDTAVQLSDTQAEQVLPALQVFGDADVQVSDVSVNDIAAIGGLGDALASMTVSDSNTDIHNDLVLNTGSELYQYRGKIDGVTVTGGRVDILSSEVADVQLSALALLPTGSLVVDGVPVADVAGMAGLTGLYQMTVSDTAANVQADMVSAGAHDLETYHAKIASITVTGGRVTLDAADASAASDAVALLSSSSLVVTGVAVANTSAVDELTALAWMTVSDSNSDVLNDLTSGHSLLELNAGAIDGIAFSSGSDSITLTGVEAAAVMDVLAALPTGSLTVTGALASQVAALTNLDGALASMTVVDTTTNIRANLANGATSSIEANIGHITSIAFTGTLTTISLSYDTAMDVLSALAMLPADNELAVQNVLVANLGNLHDFGAALGSITVTDSAANIQSDLISGGAIEAAVNEIAQININDDGSITLTDAQADPVLLALALLPSGSLTVTGVPAGAEVTAFYNLGDVLTGMTVSDTAANIGSDLSSGTSIEAAIGKITSISVSDDNLIALTYTAAATVPDALAKLPADSLTVSAVPVTDIASIAALSALSTMAVRDSSEAISNDLNLAVVYDGVSEIYSNIATISSITPTGPDQVLLYDNAADAVYSALSKLPTGSLIVQVVPLSDVANLVGLGTVLLNLLVSDTGANVQYDLTSGSTIATYAYKIGGISLSSGQVTLTDAQADSVYGVLGLLTGADSLVVTGVSVSDIVNIAPLQALDHMTVSDSAADIANDLAKGSSASELDLNAALITGVSLTDSTPLGAANAAALVPLAGKLTGSPFAVSDTALAVDTNRSGLETLGAHISSVTVSDTAADVGTYASQLATLASDVTLYISLTDATAESPVTADVAAGLVPVKAYLASNTVDVTDTGEHIVADLTELVALGGALGTITLSDATTTTVATIEDGAEIGPHLAPGTTLQVSDTAASIYADLTDGHSMLEGGVVAGLITAITVNNDTTLSLTDTQAEAVLPALGVLVDTAGLTMLDVSVHDIPTLAALPALSYGINVSDDAATISTDLLKGVDSSLYIYRSQISGVTVTGGTVDLPYTELSGAESAALALLPANTLDVTDVPVDQIATMVAYPGLYQMTVSDTAANIQADLVSIGTHLLETNYAKIASIASTGSDNEVQLNYSDASAAMDALKLLITPNVLVVNDVPLADIPTIASLNLWFMTVSASASAVQSDLLNGSGSVLEQNENVLFGISFTSGSSITLTGSEASAVIDTLVWLPADSLTVTGASVELLQELDATNALSYGVLASLTMSDTAAHIESDLALGASSEIEKSIGIISSIGITDSNVVDLSYTAASAVTSALAKLPSGSLTVDDVPVADIGTIGGLGAALISMTVSDTGIAVQNDLNQGGASVIETHVNSISSISLSDEGSVTLSDSAADTVMSALALLPSGSLTVNAVGVDADIAAFYDLGDGAILAGMSVYDSAANIQSDLISGGLIEAAISKITSISFSSGSTVALTYPETLLVPDVLAKLPAGGLTVSAVPVTDIASVAALSALSTMAVYDTGATITSDLALGADSVIESNVGKISGITLNGGAVSLTDSQADAVFSALADLPNGSLTVTGVPISDVAHIGSLGAVLAGMTVQASTSGLQSALASGSALTTYASHITSISLTGGSDHFTLTDAQADSAIALLDLLPTGSLVVTGVPVSDIADIAALTSLDHMTVVDAGATIQTDLALGDGSSLILTNIGEIASVAADDASLGTTVATAIYAALGSTFDESGLTISDTAANLLSTAAGADAGVLSAAEHVTLSVNDTGESAENATTLYTILGHTLSGMTLDGRTPWATCCIMSTRRASTLPARSHLARRRPWTR